MKKILIISIACLFFITLYSFSDNKLKEPQYKSEKPQYAKILLVNSKELVLLFDESQGTGTGYDTMYADVNLNNDLTDDAAIAGTGPGGILVNYKLNVNAGNAAYVLNFQRFKKAGNDNCAVHIKASLDEKETKWLYIQGFKFLVSEDINKAVPLKNFAGGTKLLVSSSVSEKNGQLQINIKVEFVDENNTRTSPPAVSKNGQLTVPSFTIENESGEKIISANLKRG